jgi:hypothetical protein
VSSRACRNSCNGNSASIAFVAAAFRARRSGDIFARSSLKFLRPALAAFPAAFVTLSLAK